jgi:hypothetical protein
MAARSPTRIRERVRVNRLQTVVRLPRGYSSRPASETDAEMIYRVIYDYDVSIVGYSDFARDRSSRALYRR